MHVHIRLHQSSTTPNVARCPSTERNSNTFPRQRINAIMKSTSLDHICLLIFDSEGIAFYGLLT